jgi:hypothetical protein
MGVVISGCVFGAKGLLMLRISVLRALCALQIEPGFDSSTGEAKNKKARRLADISLGVVISGCVFGAKG